MINTSRGAVVDEDALLAKLESCPNFWVGTDVFNGEPSAKVGDFIHPIAQHPRVYGTHHCGASTKQAESAIGAEALRIIEKFAATGHVDNENCVNKAKASEEGTMHALSVRYLDVVGVLASCFKVLSEHGCNVQELENIVFQQREACVANIMFEGHAKELDKVVAELKRCDKVLDVKLSKQK